MFVKPYLFGALTLLSASSALALTCANDYGSSAGCASNTTAAGDCTTLGYSKDNVDGCEHYLYCPFDTSYKRCATEKTPSCAELGFTQEDKSEWCNSIVTCQTDASYTLCASQVGEQVCPVGELNPTCQSGYGLYRVAETEDGTGCYECKGALGSGYVDEDTYFAQISSSGAYLPAGRTQTAELLKGETELVKTQCYSQCSSRILLKPVSTNNCPVGSVVLWYGGLPTSPQSRGFPNGAYCTTATSGFSNCATNYRIGVVAYHQDNDVYAISTDVSGASGNGVEFMPSGLWNQNQIVQCPGYYRSSKKSGEYYYNITVLTGYDFWNNKSVSTEFSKQGCTFSSQSINRGLLSEIVHGYYFNYGLPDRTALQGVSKNLDEINETLSKIGMPVINKTMSSDCDNPVWYEYATGIFSSPYYTSSEPLVNTAGISGNGYIMDAECKALPVTEKAQGIMITNVSEL